MCRLCGEADCKKGSLCQLDPYYRSDDFRAAFHRVQQYEEDLTFRSMGCELFYLAPGAKRPAELSKVWSGYKAKAARGFICPYCQRYYTVGDVDHRIPWRQYICRFLHISEHTGKEIPMLVARVLASDPANLQLLCASCNRSKGDRMEGTPGFDTWLKTRRSDLGDESSDPFDDL